MLTVTYLLCYGLGYFKKQGLGSIQGQQWKECCREGTANQNSAAVSKYRLTKQFTSWCSKGTAPWCISSVTVADNDTGEQKVDRDIRYILALSSPEIKRCPEEYSSEDSSLQHFFQRCLLRGWRRFCQLIPEIHEKAQGLVPLQTLRPCSFTASNILVVSHVSPDPSNYSDALLSVEDC